MDFAVREKLRSATEKLKNFYRVNTKKHAVKTENPK
jgi:hypothetical protein